MEIFEFSTPNTHLVRTINGSTRTTIYYDPDVFDEKIILSASLIIDSEDIPYEQHWNTIFDEDMGTSGTDYQQIDEIAIPIYPIPKRTKILGEKKVKQDTSSYYSLPDTYDGNNLYTYEWELIGNATFIDGTKNNLGNDNKEIMFGSRGTVTISIKVSNNNGCYRYIIRNIFIGEVTRKMLVVRYPYF